MAEDYYQFEVKLDYVMISQPSYATEWNCVSKTERRRLRHSKKMVFRRVIKFIY